MNLTYAQVAHGLVHATDKEQLLEASQQIQHVENLDHREELAVIFKTRSAEFNPRKEQ